MDIPLAYNTNIPCVGSVTDAHNMDAVIFILLIANIIVYGIMTTIKTHEMILMTVLWFMRSHLPGIFLPM